MGNNPYSVSLRGVRKGDVAISSFLARRLLRFARNDRFLANVILEKHSDEESRCWQAAPVNSKNEMLHFVQHDKLLHGILPSPFHSPLETTLGNAYIVSIPIKKAPAVRGLSVISSESLYDRYACGLGSLGTLFNCELHALAFI